MSVCSSPAESAAREEVLPVYVRPDSAQQPVRLVAWADVDLEPGERRRVEIPLPARELPVLGELVVGRVPVPT